MTEAEWLACTDPDPMVEFLLGKASDRKLRLVACACCRRIWDHFTDEPSRKAIEVVERCVDDRLNEEELNEFSRRIPSRCWVMLWPASVAVSSAIKGAITAVRTASWIHLLKDASMDLEQQAIAAYAAEKNERNGQSAIIREIFGNPFRPAVLMAPGSSENATIHKIA